MSVVISDTTPLRYLIEIEEVHILEKLFGKIIIPEKVAEELQRPKTPQKVKYWMRARPAWLEMRQADLSLFTPQKKIGDGEREAFALALEIKADALLVTLTEQGGARQILTLDSDFYFYRMKFFSFSAASLT